MNIVMYIRDKNLALNNSRLQISFPEIIPCDTIGRGGSPHIPPMWSLSLERRLSDGVGRSGSGGTLSRGAYPPLLPVTDGFLTSSCDTQIRVRSLSSYEFSEDAALADGPLQVPQPLRASPPQILRPRDQCEHLCVMLRFLLFGKIIYCHRYYAIRKFLMCLSNPGAFLTL